MAHQWPKDGRPWDPNPGKYYFLRFNGISNEVLQISDFFSSYKQIVSKQMKLDSVAFSCE